MTDIDWDSLSSDFSYWFLTLSVPEL